MPKDLHELPRFEDGWSFLYLEHCKIEQEAKAIASYDAEGKVCIPCASLSLLLLGPGSSISHEAVKNLSENGCLIGWCGEGAVRFYAHGYGETRKSAKLIKQAKLVSIDSLRLKVVRNMYQLRFKEPIPEDYTIEQLRGLEGQRVKKAYLAASSKTGVEWFGRNYKTRDWSQSDPVNRALSAANSCLYGICHAAIVSMGYSPGLGFIHTGKQLSFVYDIADFYKEEITIPISFEAVSLGLPNLERNIRLLCRDSFTVNNLLSKIVRDIEKVLSVEATEEEYPDYDEEDAYPAGIWDPHSGPINGGINFG